MGGCRHHRVLYVLYIRPKMYPKIEYEQARTFTPKEVEDWNKAMDANKSR
jgi:hypothetical protein